eukprot:scaffold11567_cov31-Tisochrysis_lutea.AAC.9
MVRPLVVSICSADFVPSVAGRPAQHAQAGWSSLGIAHNTYLSSTCKDREGCNGHWTRSFASRSTHQSAPIAFTLASLATRVMRAQLVDMLARQR